MSDADMDSVFRTPDGGTVLRYFDSETGTLHFDGFAPDGTDLFFPPGGTEDTEDDDG